MRDVLAKCSQHGMSLEPDEPKCLVNSIAAAAYPDAWDSIEIAPGLAMQRQVNLPVLGVMVDERGSTTEASQFAQVA